MTDVGHPGHRRRGRLRGRRGLGRVDGRDRGGTVGGQDAAPGPPPVPRGHEHRGPRHVLRLLHARIATAQGRGRDRRRRRGRAARAGAGRGAAQHLRRRDRDHLPRRAPQGGLGTARDRCRRPDPAPRRAPGRRRRGRARRPPSSSRRGPGSRGSARRSSWTPRATPTCARSLASGTRPRATSIRPRR